MIKSQKIDKQTFKQIFEEHFEEFKKKYPRYQADYIEKTVRKMLGCAEEENGYARYKCMDCLEESGTRQTNV